MAIKNELILNSFTSYNCRNFMLTGLLGRSLARNDNKKNQARNND